MHGIDCPRGPTGCARAPDHRPKRRNDQPKTPPVCASALPILAAKAHMLGMYENATLLPGSLRAQEYKPISDPRDHLDAPSALAGTPHIAELRRGRFWLTTRPADNATSPRRGAQDTHASLCEGYCARTMEIYKNSKMVILLSSMVLVVLAYPRGVHEHPSMAPNGAMTGPKRRHCTPALCRKLPQTPACWQRGKPDCSHKFSPRTNYIVGPARLFARVFGPCRSFSSPCR